MRVYVKDTEGRAQFTGEDLLGHTPKGETVSIKTGEAFDVRITGRVISLSTNRSLPLEADMEYKITNSKNEDISVDLRQIIPGEDHNLVDETHKSVKEDAFTRLWKVPVPAGGETSVKFTITQSR